MFIYVFCFLLILNSMMPLAYAEDTNPEGEKKDLYIKSTTRLYSAQCEILSLGYEKDQERVDIGIGEVVDLELDGKLLPLVQKNDVEWSLSEEGKKWATLEINEENKFLATLTAKKDAICNGEVRIEVKTNLSDKPKTKKFNIFVPESIEARNARIRIEGAPQDGEIYKAGASTKLALFFHPLKVSFLGIDFIEDAMDAPDDVPEWGGPHRPHAEPEQLGSMNEYYFDSIGIYPDPDANIENTVEALQDLPIPCSYFYRCAFYTVDGTKRCCLIGNTIYLQNFDWSFDGIRWFDNLKNIKVKISKFGCSVERSTTGEAVHIDN